MGNFVTFGEALVRMSPPGHQRLGQPGNYFEIGPAGGGTQCCMRTRTLE